MEAFLSPAGLLINDYPTSSEEDSKDLRIVGDFRTPGTAFGQQGNVEHGNFSGSVGADILHTLLSSPGNSSKVYNASSYDFTVEYPDYSQNQYVRAVFIFLFITECCIGVLGNFLVCLTVYRNKSMHSPVNYYIVNLGFCDFLVGAVVLPVKLFELTADAEMNMLNDFWCTAVRYLETIVVFASVFTLVAICFERYNAVVYPVQSRINMTNLRIRRVLTGVWVIPGLVAAPNLYHADSVSHYLFSEIGEFSRVTCFDRFSDDFRLGYFMFLFIFMYSIPLGFIAVTCFSIARVLLKEIPVQPRQDPRAITLEQGRRKVAKMVLVVVFAFVVCWSPYFIVTVITQLQTENFLHKGQYFFTMLLINLLAFTNSCVNPFVYFAMSARFRKGFLCIVRSLRFCSRRTRYSPENSQSSVRQTSHRTVNGVLIRPNQASRRYTSTHLAHSNSITRTDANGRRPCPNATGGGSVHCSPRLSRSFSPVTPNKSTGNNKIQRSSKMEHDRRLSSSKTILLQINHCRSSSCCNHLVPLITHENGNIIIQENLDDHVFPWEESCNL